MPVVEVARRDALVEAAFRLVAERGLEGLRLRDVASVVGIDHSTLHHYFPGKQDLIAAVALEATRPFWGTMPKSGSPTEKIVGHLTTLGQMILDRPDLHVVLREYDLRARRDPEVAAIIERGEAGWRSSLRSVLEDGIGDRSWAVRLDPIEGAELIISTVKGASLQPATARVVFALLVKVLVSEA